MPDAPTDDEQLIAEVAALRERVRELEARDGPAPPKALQAERDRAQRYLDVAAVMLVGLDVEGRVTLANRRACEVLGRASEEIVGQSWVECFVPEDAREAIHATVTGIARGEVPYSEERLGPVLTASGDVRTIRWQNARTEDDQGRFIDSLSSGHDVTGELTASHALRQSEDTMAAILSAMPDLVLHQDADGRYLNCFKAPDVDTLLPVEEFLGKRMEEVLPEALTRPSRDMIDRVLRTGEAATSQYDLDMAEGVRSYDLRMAPVGEDEVVSVIRDVTEARRAVDRLEQSERRFRALFEESPLGLMIGDGDGVLLSTNRAMAALLGYPASELRGKSFADITLPEDIDETRAAIANLRTSATRAERLEKRYVRKDGDVVRAKVHVVALWDEEDGSERLFALVDDVTEQRQTASLLATRTRQQSALAQFSQEALGSRDVPALMQRACELLADTLDIEYAKVLELLPGAGGFLLKTGVGWQDGLVGKASISAGRDSQAGYTLLSGEPVVVPNLWEETRFCGPPLLFDHLVTSGMSVQIQGSDETDAPYGVLGAHTRRRRDFSPDDVNFLAGFATVIAATVVRSRHEQEIEDLNAQLEARVEARTGDLNQANERLQGELARRGITEEALRRTESERSQLTQRILTIQVTTQPQERQG